MVRGNYMVQVTADSAQRDHNIFAVHEKMANGEIRFRLRKSDGTAYIRTEAGLTSGWQNSHFHEHVLETYIVQSGWIAFAELIDSELFLCIYGANESVVSRPGIIHNVYLPSHAVIHTVKHGLVSGDDRCTDARTKAFDKVTHALDAEQEIRAAAIRRYCQPKYSEEYRNFDNLIWQIPAWSTGIFALAIQGLFGILPAKEPIQQVASGLLALFTALCLACFSIVMMRFRTHQRGLKAYKPTTVWFSASTLTQCLVAFEATIALAIALLIFGLRPEVTIPIAVSLLVGTIWLVERAVRRAHVLF